MIGINVLVSHTASQTCEADCFFRLQSSPFVQKHFSSDYRLALFCRSGMCRVKISFCLKNIYLNDNKNKHQDKRVCKKKLLSVEISNLL